MNKGYYFADKSLTYVFNTELFNYQTTKKMESSLVDEFLHLAFHNSNNNPAVFVHFFNSAKHLDAFAYDHDKKGFTYLNTSFKKELGYGSRMILSNNLMVKNYIHPNDKLIYKKYFENISQSKKGRENTRINEVSKMRCRVRLNKETWKIRIFYSFDYNIGDDQQLIKVGIIVHDGNKLYDTLIYNFKNKLFALVNSFDVSKKDVSNKIVKSEPKIISRRETEVLILIGEGFITKEIAIKLNISPTTVITHRNNLKLKIDAKNTAELVNKANHLMLL